MTVPLSETPAASAIKPLMSSEFQVDVEGFMIFLSDAEKEADTSQVWMSYRRDDKLGVFDGFVVIGSSRCGNCSAQISVFSQQPPEADDADHITECTARFPSGGINLSGSLTEQFDGSSCLDVDADVTYCIRVVHRGLRTISQDKLSGSDKYIIQMWPCEEGIEPRVLVRFDPYASVDSLPRYDALAPRRSMQSAPSVPEEEESGAQLRASEDYRCALLLSLLFPLISIPRSLLFPNLFLSGSCFLSFSLLSPP